MQFELKDAAYRIVDEVSEHEGTDFSTKRFNVTSQEVELLAAKVILEYALDHVSGWELQDWLDDIRSNDDVAEDPLNAATEAVIKRVKADGVSQSLTKSEVEQLAAKFIQEALSNVFWFEEDFNKAVEELRSCESSTEAVNRAKNAIHEARKACRNEAEVSALMHALTDEVDQTRKLGQTATRN